MLGSEIQRFQVYFTEDRRVELAALAAALAVAAGRAAQRRYADPLLLGVLAAFVLFVTVVSSKSQFYMILFYPWLTLLLAGATSWLGGFARPFGGVVIGLAALAVPFVFG